MTYGAQIKFGIGRQTGAGSGQAVTAAGSFHHFPLVNEDVGLDKEEVISQNLTGRFEQGAVYDGVNRINGTIEFEVTPKSLGIVLASICNTYSEVTSGSLKTRTFMPSTQDYSSTLVAMPVTVYKQFSDASSAEHYFDCQVGQLEFSYAQNQLLTGRATVAGGSRVATGIGSLGLTLDTQDLQLGSTWDATSITWGGTGIGQFTALTVALNENIEPVYSLNGTLAPYKFTRSGYREVTVSGTILFDSRSVYNDYTVGTQRRLLVYAYMKKQQVQSGYYSSLLIDVPQCKITQMKPGASGPGELSASFTARGVLDPSSGYTIAYTLANTFAGPY